MHGPTCDTHPRTRKVLCKSWLSLEPAVRHVPYLSFLNCRLGILILLSRTLMKIKPKTIQHLVNSQVLRERELLVFVLPDSVDGPWSPLWEANRWVMPA